MSIDCEIFLGIHATCENGEMRILHAGVGDARHVRKRW